MLMEITEVVQIEKNDNKEKTKLTRILLGLSYGKPSMAIMEVLKKNHDVVIVHNGKALIDKLFNFKPHLVIVESQLESVSGIQILHVLKRDPELCKIPVMLVVSEGYTIGEFCSRESGVDCYRYKTELLGYEILANAELLCAKSETDKISAETWVRIQKELTGSGFIKSFSNLVDQTLIETAIINRIAILAQEPTDFRNMTRSIMRLLRDILEYHAGAISIFSSDEIFSYFHENLNDREKEEFLKQAVEYSDIYYPLNVLHRDDEFIEAPLGTFTSDEKPDRENPTIFTIPLESQKSILGTLTLLTYKSAARREYYIRTLNIIAHHISLAINNALLYQEVHRLSIVDELTGLPNRRAFYLKFQDEIARSRRFGQPFSLAILDIDHFKDVNDTYGHIQGDIVLKELAKVFSSSIRDKVDTVGRLGGEEFVILFPQTELKNARAVVDRLHKAVQNHPVCLHDNSGEINVTVSVGLVTVESKNDLAAEEIMIAADKALYIAKESGRNRIVEAGSIS
jgi:diguanylate cyclase (GGDEF)-like protein